jgi:hypothetical protein
MIRIDRIVPDSMDFKENEALNSNSVRSNRIKKYLKNHRNLVRFHFKAFSKFFTHFGKIEPIFKDFLRFSILKKVLKLKFTFHLSFYTLYKGLEFL